MKANSLKVMVVEDDLVSGKLLRMMVSELADQVLVAADSHQAFELYDSNPDIDVILMDIRLPGLNGYEITKKIRERNDKVIIIAQTACTYPEDIAKAFAVGCDDYIAKPIRTKNLVDMIWDNYHNKSPRRYLVSNICPN